MPNKNDNLEKRLNQIENNLQSLNKKVDKIIGFKGSKDISSFAFKTEEVWEKIEKNLLKTGLLLEYEIVDCLKKYDINVRHQYKFDYPNESGTFYYDLFINKDIKTIYLDPMLNYNPSIKHKEFEVDVVAEEIKIFENERYKIRVYVNYIIECKTRINPPLNYLIIPLQTDQANMEKKIKFPTSAFLRKFLVDLDVPRTILNVIKIKCSNLDIDDVPTIEKAFWQIFRYIDQESGKFSHFKIFPNFLDFSKVQIPEDLKLPKSYQEFNNFFNSNLKSGKIPKEITNKIIINFDLYIPIVVVNSNLYAVDLESAINTELFKHNKRINWFCKRIAFEQDKYGSTYNYHNPFFMLLMYLRFNDLPHLHGNFEPEFFGPVLDLLIISKDNFNQAFKQVREEIFEKLEIRINEDINELITRNYDELLKFQVFGWILAIKDEWRYELYSDFLQKITNIKKIAKD